MRVLASIAHAGVLAQQAPDPAAELRRQQQQLEFQRQQAESQADVLVPKTQAKQAHLPQNEQPCFVLSRIALVNADYPPGSGKPAPNPVFTETFEWLLASTAGPAGDDSAMGKCLGVEGVRMVLQRAQDALVARGYVTTRVLTQAQDLAGGVLVLSVVPGHVHAIRFKDAGEPGVSVRTALPMRTGEILNLRDMEQGLENFKRVPTAEADIQVEPAAEGTTPDQSDLVIAYQQPRSIRLAFNADDSGGKSTGRYQGSATLSVDNPLGLSDLFYITGNHDMGGGDAGARGTRGSVLHYSLPLDYWVLGVTYASNRYFQNVAGKNQDYVYSGTSESMELKIARVVRRDAASKTTLSLKGWQRLSNSFIEDTEVLVQRRVVGGWELGLGHKHALGDMSLEGTLAYKRGTPDFDSIAAPEEAFNEGTSKLGLWLLDLGASVPFTVHGMPFTYSPMLRVQDNTTPLTPQDRFAIGGRYTVRGFDGESSLVGERGWTLRNDWSMALGGSGQEAYLGLDAGEVSGPSTNAQLGKTLSGGVIGVRGSCNCFKTRMQYDVFVGAPLYKPDGFKTAETTAGFNLNLSW
jgi:hemolysin activation/secretion protein